MLHDNYDSSITFHYNLQCNNSKNFNEVKETFYHTSI